MRTLESYLPLDLINCQRRDLSIILYTLKDIQRLIAFEFNININRCNIRWKNLEVMKIIPLRRIQIETNDL
jgi:hypothetical protein